MLVLAYIRALDALNGNANYIKHRAALVVIAKSPLARIRDFARQRGWSKLRGLRQPRACG